LSLGEKPNSILHPNHDANHHPNHVDIIFTSLWLVVSTLGKNPGHWELGRSPLMDGLMCPDKWVDLMQLLIITG
jgi:hypothetical protein